MRLDHLDARHDMSQHDSHGGALAESSGIPAAWKAFISFFIRFFRTIRFDLAWARRRRCHSATSPAIFRPSNDQTD